MDQIEANRTCAAHLGWTPEDLGGADFDDALVVAIRDVQGALGVGVDGVCGPATYKAWLDRRLDRLRAGKAQSTDWLRDAGLVALAEAKRTWLGRIVDPPSPSPEYAASRVAIDDMIRSRDGLAWTWQTPYVKDGDYEWCGAFASFAWRAAGVAEHWRTFFFSSTFRLDQWARYLPFNATANPRPAAGPYRQVLDLDETSGPGDAVFGPGDGPRAGDILLVGTGKPAYGSHVTVVEHYDADAGVFTTIEGNGTGAWPNGSHVQGVVRGRRPVGGGTPAKTYHARRLIRPAPADLDA